MVSESVRRFVLAVVVMMFVSNRLRVSIDAASHVLAQQQRLQLQRTTLVLNYHQKACAVCSSVLLLQSTKVLLSPSAFRSSGCGVYICWVSCTYCGLPACGSNAPFCCGPATGLTCGCCIRSIFAQRKSAQVKVSCLDKSNDANTPREVYWQWDLDTALIRL